MSLEIKFNFEHCEKDSDIIACVELGVDTEVSNQFKGLPLKLEERKIYQLNMIQGPKLTFFGRRQLATKIFFSRQMEKCSRQKVSLKLFLCSETQGKIFAIDVIRNQTSAEMIF